MECPSALFTSVDNGFGVSTWWNAFSQSVAIGEAEFSQTFHRAAVASSTSSTEPSILWDRGTWRSFTTSTVGPTFLDVSLAQSFVFLARVVLTCGAAIVDCLLAGSPRLIYVLGDDFLCVAVVCADVIEDHSLVAVCGACGFHLC